MKKNITLCLAACSLASNHTFGMLPKQTTLNQHEIKIKIETEELQEIKKMLHENKEILHITFVQNSLQHNIFHYQLKYILHHDDNVMRQHCTEQHAKYTAQLEGLQKYYYKLINNSSSTSSSERNSSSAYSSENNSSSASSNED